MKITSYLTGLLLSIVFTFAGPALIWLHESSGHQFPTHFELYAACAVLAFLQLIVQLIFFLHIREENGPRWRFGWLVFSLVIVFIIGGGALWIMSDLGGRMMMDQGGMMQYMEDQGAF